MQVTERAIRQTEFSRGAATQARWVLLDALGVDGVLTVPQAAAMAGLPRQAVAAVLGSWAMTRVRLVRPTADSAPHPIALLLLSQRGAVLAGERLGRRVTPPPVALHHEVEHALGVAQLRHQLDVPPEHWTTAAELVAARARAGRQGRGLPDGIAAIQGTRLAAEYDFGNYTAEQIALKQRTAREFADAIVWGAPTPRRQRWLRERGCEDVIVVSVPR